MLDFSMKDESSRVTLEMIAESLGISRGTVDRAIHNRGRINEKTRREVIEKARELGYGAGKVSSLLSLRKRIQAAIILPSQPDYFFQPVLQGAVDAAKNLQDPVIELELFQTGREGGRQGGTQEKEIIQKLPEEIEALILLPRSMDEPKRAVDLWKSQDSKESPHRVVTVNSDLPDSSRDCFVGQDLYHSGRIAGELLAKMVRFGKGAVLPITGKQNLFGHVERIRGFLDYMQSHDPGRSILPTEECLDDEEQAEAIVQSKMSSLTGHKTVLGSPLAAIFCATGSACIGAARALEKLTFAGGEKPVLIGYDRSEELLKYLKSSIIDALVSQDPYAQGAEAVKILHRICQGEAAPEGKLVFTPTEIVLKELVPEEIA